MDILNIKLIGRLRKKIISQPLKSVFFTFIFAFIISFIFFILYAYVITFIFSFIIFIILVFTYFKQNIFSRRNTWVQQYQNYYL